MSTKRLPGLADGVCEWHIVDAANQCTNALNPANEKSPPTEQLAKTRYLVDFSDEFDFEWAHYSAWASGQGSCSWPFENFTGRGGEKGACKDPADLARYMALAKLEMYRKGDGRGNRGEDFSYDDA